MFTSDKKKFTSVHQHPQHIGICLSRFIARGGVGDGLGAFLGSGPAGQGAKVQPLNDLRRLEVGMLFQEIFHHLAPLADRTQARVIDEGQHLRDAVGEIGRVLLVSGEATVKLHVRMAHRGAFAVGVAGILVVRAQVQLGIVVGELE